MLPKREHLSISEADALHAKWVDQAIDAAGLTNADVAFALEVSESHVRKMRSINNREQMSQPQMLVLGFHCPAFYIEYNAAINERTRWFDMAAARWQRMAAAFLAIGAR